MNLKSKFRDEVCSDCDMKTQCKKLIKEISQCATLIIWNQYSRR